MVEDGPHGPALKAVVTAAPVDNKANAALIRLLARHFDVAPRDLSIIRGTSSRLKLVEFAGDPAVLIQHIEKKLGACATPN